MVLMVSLLVPQDAFVELYQTRTPARFWTLGTVFGLVLLGAAFITLGVLLAQR